MSKMKTVSIQEASNASLRWYAGTKLGLDDIKKGQQSAFLIGKIRSVEPDVDMISVPEEGENVATTTDTLEALQARREAENEAAAQVFDPEQPQSRESLHQKNDPKVVINVARTNDKTRPRRVFLTCNGSTIEIQRGVDVEIPFRFLETLQNAVEKRSLETSDTNPVTGLPIREWAEQKSYDFQIVSMPSAEVIKAWHERTKNAQL